MPLKVNNYKRLKFVAEKRDVDHPKQHGLIGRPSSRSGEIPIFVDYLNISDSSGNSILSDSFFPQKTIRIYFSDYLNNLLKANKVIEKSAHIADRDIWVESISGFLFGDIKTVSTLAKFIRLIHLIIVYYLIIMISKLIEHKKWFEVKKESNKTQ